LYISLGEPLPGDAWAVRIHHKPFVDWIWGGCLLIALGGLVAICDRRYRIARVAAREETTVSGRAPVGAMPVFASQARQ
jgi:cytochrome c-type biogenesis protein CcmF